MEHASDTESHGERQETQGTHHTQDTQEIQESITHPIRYYDVMSMVFDEMNTMKLPEIRGATKIMSILADYFWDLHFNSKHEIDQKALVKTLDEIRDTLFDRMYNQSYAKNDWAK